MMKKQASLGKNALLNAIKQGMAVIFPLITFPYVSRVLGSGNYGKVNFSLSIVSYFALIAMLGISSYAIREGARLRSNREKLEQFCNQIYSINIITTCFAYLLLLVTLLFWKNLYEYRLLIVLLSSTLVFTTVGADWVNSVFEDYQYITIRYIVFQVLALFCLFIFVRDKNDYVIYTLITIFASVGANVLNYFYIKRYVRLRFGSNLHLKTHIKPILVLFSNILAITIYVNSDITILGFMKGDKAVGIYSVSVKIYTVIKQLLSAMIVVTVPRLSSLLGESKVDEYHSILQKTLKMLISLVLPAIVGLFMISKYVVYIVGGSEYMGGYVSLRILSITLGMAVFGTFFTNSILIPNKKEKYFLMATCIGALINLVVNLAVIPYFSYNGAAVTTLFAEFVVLLLSIHYAKGHYEFFGLKNIVLSSCLGCVTIALVCILIQLFTKNVVVIVAGSIILSTLLYFTILMLMKNEIVLAISQRFLNKRIKS